MKIAAAKHTLVLASIYQESDPASIQQQALARLCLQAPKQPAPGTETAIKPYLKKLHLKISLAASSLPSPSFQPGDAELCLWKRTASALVAGLVLDGGQGPLPGPTSAFPVRQVREVKRRTKAQLCAGRGRGGSSDLWLPQPTLPLPWPPAVRRDL